MTYGRLLLRLTVVVVLAWVSRVALGQPANGRSPVRRLTLPEALDLARQNYPLLRAQLASIRAADADQQTVRTTYLPRVGMQAQLLNATSNQVRGAYLSNGGLTVPISGSIKPNGFTGETNWTSLASLLIDWEVVTFGRQQADRNRAQLAAEQAQADYDGELFTHQVRVCDAYLLALNALKSTDVQLANLQRAEAVQRITRANTLAGLKAGIDSAIANAEVARIRLRLLEERQQARRQVNQLSGMIGLPDELIELDSMQFYTQLPPLSIGPVVSVASGPHPQLRVFQKRIEQREADAAFIRMTARPTLALVGSVWGRGSGIRERPAPDESFRINSSLGAGLPLRAFNYMLGATLTWRPTELLRTREALVAQRERITAERETLTQQAQQLQIDDRNARLQLDLATEAVRQAPLQLDAARQAYLQAQVRYESGLDNILTLTQTTVLLERAEIDQAIAVNNYWRSLLLRAATAGDLAIFIQQMNR